MAQPCTLHNDRIRYRPGINDVPSSTRLVPAGVCPGFMLINMPRAHVEYDTWLWGLGIEWLADSLYEAVDGDHEGRLPTPCAATHPDLLLALDAEAAHTGGQEREASIKAGTNSVWPKCTLLYVSNIRFFTLT
jgi:hypothetical protein